MGRSSSTTRMRIAGHARWAPRARPRSSKGILIWGLRWVHGSRPTIPLRDLERRPARRRERPPLQALRLPRSRADRRRRCVPGLPSPEAMGIQIEFFLRLLHRKLTRFDRGSELCALNAEPGESCSVSPTLAVAVDAALWAARRSDGLVDPTLVGRARGRRLRDLARRPAAGGHRRGPGRRSRAEPPRPRADARWQRGRRRHRRRRRHAGPRGVRIDTGGSGKGLAADLAADRLGGYATFVVDAGGDLRLGGERPLEAPGPHRPPASQTSPPTSSCSTVAPWPPAASRPASGGPSTGFAHHLLESVDRRARLDRRDPGDARSAARPWRPRRWRRWRSCRARAGAREILAASRWADRPGRRQRRALSALWPSRTLPRPRRYAA